MIVPAGPRRPIALTPPEEQERKCKRCGRPIRLHKHSGRKSHKWVRVRCDRNYINEVEKGADWDYGRA